MFCLSLGETKQKEVIISQHDKVAARPPATVFPYFSYLWGGEKEMEEVFNHLLQHRGPVIS